MNNPALASDPEARRPLRAGRQAGERGGMRREKDNQPRAELWVGSGTGTNRWLAVVRGINPAPDGATNVKNGQEIQTRLFED